MKRTLNRIYIVVSLVLLFVKKSVFMAGDMAQQSWAYVAFLEDPN